jgi:rhodanese-related sulfurtransferase
MFSIKSLFTSATEVDFAELVKQGALILDVRTKGEFAQGHIKGSTNIPVDELKINLGKLKKEQTIITCCRSGNRSAMAKSVLEQNGFKQVFNGGGWQQLQAALS